MTTDTKPVRCVKGLPELSTAAINEFTEWFQYFDKDGTGQLGKEDFKKVMYAIGCNPTDQEMDTIWKTTDIDGNGVIDHDEYLKLLQSLRKDPETEKAELIEAFRKLDKGKSNTVRRSQMRRCFEVLGCSFGDLSKDELESLLDKVDSNGDGLIDIDEFVTTMLEKPGI